MARSKLAQSIFWATVIVALLYSSYRYPLQINSAQTSPTYSDTPPLLQAAKYLILVVACAVMAFVAGGLYVPRRRLGFITLYLMLVAWPIVHFAFDGDAKHLTFPIVAGVAFFISLSVCSVTLTAVDTFMRFTLYFSLLVDLIQMILFHVTGRLPALAYEDTLAVRFGSFLDDPNGFAALSFLLLGYAYSLPRTMMNRLCILGVILCIFLSQSLTAISFLVLLIVLWGLTNHFKATLFVLLIGGLAIFLPYLFNGFSLGGNGLLDVVFTSKQASSDAHFESFNLDKLADFSVWILGGDEYLISESWWVTALNNYGLIWSGALLSMLTAFMWKLYITFNEAHSQRVKRVSLSVLLFSLYVVGASLNLPFLTVFPINFMLMLFVSLFMLDKLQDHEGLEGFRGDLYTERPRPLV
ncbi:hypothetical protein AWB77_06141 [Caballeronia fortuita]|uniref:O-antigen polymerase n=1 Tax=Caballeronia fortuita TaxID=1777138 RepID=A0A158E187_9BURK|nr:hypothetical protein [Caballeronia fortuita]SAL00440.1 hypothetical protein AWB77_06141 [Caballeronia fortuita]